jgi:iron-sulfur cluster repair protein YtfE (RIC family)
VSLRDFPGANPQGIELAQRLLVIHDQMRRDMDEFQRLVTAIADAEGHPGGPNQVKGAMDAFRQRDWQRILPRYCAQFCTFVHGHHTVEDASMFPVLKRRNPHLAPTIKRLVSEHQQLVEHLDQITELVGALPQDPTVGPKLKAKVAEVAQLLARHLDFEEKNLSSTLVTLTYADIS